jgi:predicted dehydrogenase
MNANAVSWGVIGTGDISRSIAADLLLVAGTRRHAVASRSAERARAFAGELGFARAYGDVDELLGDPAVDIVYIGTPPATHRDLALRALRAGKPVLVEKPAGVSGDEVAEIAEEARRRGLFAMEAMWMRFNPAYRRMRAEIADGAIGEPRSVRASFGMPFPPGAGSRWSAELGGSTLLDQGIYPITLALDVLGVPASVQARGTARDDGVDLREHIDLEFADGRYAQLAASMMEWADPTASVSGTGGWIHLPFPFWATDRFAVHTGRALFEPRVEVAPRAGRGYVPMLAAVQEALLRGDREHSLHPWSEVRAVFRVIDDARACLAGPAASEFAAGQA